MKTPITAVPQAVGVTRATDEAAGREPPRDDRARKAEEVRDGFTGADAAAAEDAGISGDAPTPPGEDAGDDHPGPLNDLLHRIHAGEVAPSSLSAETRRQCVLHLTHEGFTNSEIAQLMGISERTAIRDRIAARRDFALGPGILLGDELLGEFQQIALASVQRLVRLTRNESAPPYARLWAEEAIVRNYQRFVETARRLHYLNDGQARLKELLKPPPESPEQEFERHRNRFASQNLFIKAANEGMAESFPLPTQAEALEAGRAIRVKGQG